MEVNQNTPEWLQMRKNKIGASDAPVILEVSPWKTPYRLWQEKLDLVQQPDQNSAMKRGHDLEDLARQELEKMTGFFFLPQVKFHSSLQWMLASLDGIDAEGRHIAEIKCPNKADHQVALSGQVPEKYIPQVQHQIEVCQVEMAYYFSFDGAAGVIVKVYRDDRYIKKMIEKEQAFWECMQSWTPPELTDKDYDLRTDDEWSSHALQLIRIRKELQGYDYLKKKEKEIEDRLKIMSDKRNCYGSGVKVTCFPRKGAIDYTSVPQIQGVDLEQYRKKPMECFRISECK